MTDTDPLAFARRLIDQGVPVFLARRDPKGIGHNKTGYWMPERWQHTKPDSRALDGYRDGMAVCAVGGGPLSVIDIDPRNGGDLIALARSGLLPRVYASARTPSGGQHLYVANLGIGKTSRDGIDYQGGLDGAHAGFAFLPPTVRASKVDGIERPYHVLVDGLNTFGQDDDSGTAIREWLLAAKSEPGTSTDGTKSFEWTIIGGDPLLEIGTKIPADHQKTLFRYACSLRARGVKEPEAERLVNARGDEDCVPQWAAGWGADSAWSCVRHAYKYEEGAAASIVDEHGNDLDPSLAKELARQEIIATARDMLAEKRARAEYREPPSWPSLRERLAEPDPPVKYAIDKLLCAGGNAVLTAAYKAGKTTMMLNVVRALADGGKFLGRFDVAPIDGKVAIWDYELSKTQHGRWLREHQIGNTDRVALRNLRGFRLPLTTKFGEDEAVRWLNENDVKVWIIDPYGRALAGIEENDNTAVGRFLEALDVIKERAGVSELIMPAHTGRKDHESGAEHARGATRLDDWADARWILVKDTLTKSRFLSADGRDVEVAEEQLRHDATTHELTFGGGDRKWVKANHARDQVAPRIAEAVARAPRINVTALRDQIGGDKDEFSKALAIATAHGGPVVALKRTGTSIHHVTRGSADERSAREEGFKDART